MEQLEHGPLALPRRWRRALVGRIDRREVMDRIVGESGWSGRFVFMTLMSAGIAILGLLLSSPAVVIGAMLISPLMGPILGLGFSLSTFDFGEMRRAVTTLALGAALGVGMAAVIVLASPLKSATAEILARTRPNLFDLLVALFSALAGSYAIIRNRGETIVGVAIATALMPPLAVVGYGLATWNLPVTWGAFALFVTNFVTITLAATVMARLFGFGHALSSQQSWLQTGLLIAAAAAMGAPLALALRQIAGEAVTTASVRGFLSEQFGEAARVTQLDVRHDKEPLAVRAVVIAPANVQPTTAILQQRLSERLGEPVDLQIGRVALAPNADASDAQRAELTGAGTQDQAARHAGDEVIEAVALAAGVRPEEVLLDRANRVVQASATPLPAASLATYRALERRAAAASEGWTVRIVPPLGPLPSIRFAEGSDGLDDAGRAAVALASWAAARWNVPALIVPGLPDGAAPPRPTLAQRRALLIAGLLREAGVTPAPGPAAGPSLALTPAVPAS